MSSARLPGKVLRPARGKPMLGYLVERLTRGLPDVPVIVATSEMAEDDAVARFCEATGVHCFRGPLDDVMGRFLGVLNATSARSFVRINGDSPLIDVALIARAVEIYRHDRPDLVTNVLRRTFPKGMSVEVVDAAAFRRAAGSTDDAQDREHVTRCFYRAPHLWRIADFTHDRNLGDLNLSVDTAADFARFEAILGGMTRPHWQYGLDDILALVPAEAVS